MIPNAYYESNIAFIWIRRGSGSLKKEKLTCLSVYFQLSIELGILIYINLINTHHNPKTWHCILHFPDEGTIIQGKETWPASHSQDVEPVQTYV